MALATNAAGKENYEGMLVKLASFEVTNENPDGKKDHGEFHANDGSGDIRVDDACKITIDPAKGDRFQSLVGVLHFSYGNFKLLPRSDDDFGAKLIVTTARAPVCSDGWPTRWVCLLSAVVVRSPHDSRPSLCRSVPPVIVHDCAALFLLSLPSIDLSLPQFNH